MGYESRLFVVEKSSLEREVKGKKMLWGDSIAVFDLSKCSLVSDKMREYKKTDTFIYATDGNTVILDDEYGEPLREIPIVDAIKILEAAASKHDYRRFNPCIQLLKGFDSSEWENLVVLHYGY